MRCDDETVLGPVAEYRALSAVPDDGVPRALDLVWTDQWVACVTEWVSGRALSDNASASESSLRRALTRVLRRAHAAGWVHGDVTPANVIVTSEGRVVLVDWELARRPGEAAGPGTPGWAPPHAWEPGFVADTRSDWYSLGVVLWEVRSGCRAYPGGLSSVLEQQNDPLRTVAQALPSWNDAAQSSETWDSPTDALRIDGVREIVERTCCDLHGVSPELCDPCAFGPPSDSRATSATALFHSRVFGKRTTVTPGQIARWSDGILEKLASQRASTRPDFLRMEWHRIATELATSASAWGLIAGSVNSETSGCGTAHASAAQPTPETHAGGPSTLPFDPSRTAATWGASAASRGRLKRTLEVILATRDVPREIVEALLPEPAGRVEDVATLVSRWGSDQSLVWVHDAWRCDLGNARRFDQKPASPADGPRDSVPSLDTPVPENLGELLRRGECAAACGNWLQAYRTCVMATTLLSETSTSERCELLRTAELWLDLGWPSAAAAVASRAPSWEEDLRTLALIARARLASGCAESLGWIAARLHIVAVSPDEVITANRVRAAERLAARDFDGARAALVAAGHTRRQAAEWSQLEYMLTLGNWARAAGKPATAERVRRYTEHRAERVGAVRIAMSCVVNDLLSRKNLNRIERATAWASAAARAGRWGLQATASYAEAMCAREWTAAGRPHVAEAVMRRWEAVGRNLDESGNASTSVMRAVRAILADWRETPDALAFVTPLGTATSEGRSRAMLGELELVGVVRGNTSQSHDRSRAMRAARACTRHHHTARHDQLRARRQLAASESSYMIGSGLAIHCARAIVQLWAGSIETVCAESLAMQSRGELDRAVCIGVIALALAWREDPGLAPHAYWFATQVGSTEEHRPVGVRRWEWTLAHANALAHSRSMQDAAGIHRAAAKEALQTMATALPATRRPNYLRRARSANWGGVDNALAPQIETTTGCDLGADFVRAASIESQSAGFRRLLRCALRLRSIGSVDDVLRETVQGVLDVCHAERAVVLFESATRRVRAKVGTCEGVRDLSPDDAEISHSVIARVRDTTGVAVIDDASAELELGDRPSVRKYRPRSVMVCALRTPSRYVGCVYVEDRSRPRSFTAAEAELLDGFASQVALALENAALVEDLRNSHRELGRARAEAVRAESLRALGRMATEVAHDLNNLLTAVLGEAQLLLTDTRFRSAYAALRVIERAAQDGGECIRRIQESTRVRSEPDYSTEDVVRVVQDVLDFTRVRCAARSGSSGIAVTCGGLRRALVRGCASELREVFMNLVVNALDAMPTGGSLSVHFEKHGGHVVIHVEDSGCGIPDAAVKQIFEPFFTTKGTKGNGLGLSIALAVIRRHGGDISVACPVTGGTKISVRLPMERGAVDLGDDELEHDDQPAHDGSTSRHFLIIDDDPSVLRVLRQMLEQVGATVEEGIGGAAGVAKLTEDGHRYDCVVTDLYMPRVSGLDVASHAAKVCPSTRVVVMSGCGTTLESEATMDRGVSETLRKPFSLDSISSLVARCAADQPS
ncbi:MAG: response regulator [Planctomycetes bacterium]|nr:response regulator [Planctomycetota bacterium]